jgi:hypothetical protein
VLVAYAVGEVMASLAPRLVTAFNAETDPLSLPVALARQGAKGIVPSIRESSYMALVLALVVSAIVAIIQPGYEAIYNAANTAFHPAEGAQYIGELRGIGPGDIITWQFLLVPLLVGIYVTIRKRRPQDILWLTWFVVLFVGGLLAAD